MSRLEVDDARAAARMRIAPRLQRVRYGAVSAASASTRSILLSSNARAVVDLVEHVARDCDLWAGRIGSVDTCSKMPRARRASSGTSHEIAKRMADGVGDENTASLRLHRTVVSSVAKSCRT